MVLLIKSQILTDFVGFTAGLEKFKEGYIDPITNQIVDMAQRVRNVARQIQRIFKKVINNIRTGIIKREQVSLKFLQD